MEAVWIALFIIVLIFCIIAYAIIEAKRTLTAPEKTARAYLVKKYRVAHTTEYGVDRGYSYYAVFKLSNGKKLRLGMNEADYVFMPNSGPCDITYLHKTLTNFRALVEADKTRI